MERNNSEFFVYLWRIHFDIWQNQYNIVKLKNKIKFNLIKKKKNLTDRGGFWATVYGFTKSRTRLSNLPRALDMATSHFCSIASDSLQPHGLQHTRLPRPLPSPGACSNSWQFDSLGIKNKFISLKINSSPCCFLPISILL